MPGLIGLQSCYARSFGLMPKIALRIDNSVCLQHVREQPSVAFVLVSKAIGVRIGLLRDLMRAGLFSCSHVRSAVNRADVFTKPLTSEKIRLGMDMTGVLCGSVLDVGPAGQTVRKPL